MHTRFWIGGCSDANTLRHMPGWRLPKAPILQAAAGCCRLLQLLETIVNTSIAAAIALGARSRAAAANPPYTHALLVSSTSAHAATRAATRQRRSAMSSAERPGAPEGPAPTSYYFKTDSSLYAGVLRRLEASKRWRRCQVRLKRARQPEQTLRPHHDR